MLNNNRCRLYGTFYMFPPTNDRAHKLSCCSGSFQSYVLFSCLLICFRLHDLKPCPLENRYGSGSKTVHASFCRHDNNSVCSQDYFIIYNNIILTFNWTALFVNAVVLEDKVQLKWMFLFGTPWCFFLLLFCLVFFIKICLFPEDDGGLELHLLSWGRKICLACTCMSND